jgi:hypothetical protein
LVGHIESRFSGDVEYTCRDRKSGVHRAAMGFP